MLGHSFTELTRQRAFMRMWFARLFGTTGNQMLMVAVGWQMYELTASAWDLGLVGLYQFLPALLLTLVAGHVADRLHRAASKRVVVLAKCGHWTPVERPDECQRELREFLAANERLAQRSQ